jgi:hypothetical protein
MCMYWDRCLSFSTFFFWPLCYLFFFDIRILITPLVSSTSSYNLINISCYNRLWGVWRNISADCNTTGATSEAGIFLTSRAPNFTINLTSRTPKFYPNIKLCSLMFTQLEVFEDSKGVIRIRKSKKDRSHNGQKKKYKRTNNDLQNIQIKLKTGKTYIIRMITCNVYVVRNDFFKERKKK